MRNVRTATMTARTPTLVKVGETATVRMMSPRRGTPAQQDRPTEALPVDPVGGVELITAGPEVVDERARSRRR